MLKAVNSILDSVKSYVTPNDDEKTNNNQNNWKPAMYASLIGLSTIATIYTARQYYRARFHDNIPTMGMKDFSYFGGHLQILTEKGGNWVYWMYEDMCNSNWPPIVSLSFPGPRNLIFIQDPALIKFALETNFESTPKGEEFIQEFEPLLGHGIFASNGENWKFHRKVGSRMFSMRNLKDFMYNISKKNTLSVIKKLKELSHEPEIDINDILGRFTLDTFCEIAFGINVNSVQTYPKTHEFGIAFDDLVMRIDKRGGDILWKIKKSLQIGNESYISHDSKIIMDFVNDILDKNHFNVNSNTKHISDVGGGQKHDLLSLFLKHNPKLTREELKDIALNFIIAGRDTTRMLLSWCIYELCLNKNKEVKNKLLAEINSYNNGDRQEPSYRQFVSGFRYLEGVLCESLRLHPSVPVIGRSCAKDIVLPIKDVNGNNYVIRKGDDVLTSPFVCGRCPKIWGSDALIFKPDRWKEKGINTYDQYQFSAFNIAPRLCLGKQFAITEAKVYMYYFLKNFTFERTRDGEISIKQGAILNMENGLFVKLNVR
eukprot:412224_1